MRWIVLTKTYNLDVIKTRNPKIYHVNYNLSHIRTSPFECK